MLISATLSKPAGQTQVEQALGKPFIKIKISAQASAKGYSYFAQMFTQTQVFHQHFTETEALDFIKNNAGITFKNCIQKTDTEEITIIANKKGKITRLTKPAVNLKKDSPSELQIMPQARKKNYLIEEETQVPFMQLLGIMNSQGKVLSSKYDKFKQINRFLEFINDIIPDLTKLSGGFSEVRPLRIADFGCGKSYLTFAVHYFLTEIKHIPCQIEGLDLKEDVIKYCNEITEKLKLKGLVFHTGNIAGYSGKEAPDLIITLHACDTATDYALEYAVEKKASAILSVPCCQHEINQQLQKNKSPVPEDFSPLLKWGIIREKFSSLVTDALRGEWLEQQGYNVQMLEFIDMEHTPKNIMIRAVKNGKGKTNESSPKLKTTLGINPEIWK